MRVLVRNSSVQNRAPDRDRVGRSVRGREFPLGDVPAERRCLEMNLADGRVGIRSRVGHGRPSPTMVSMRPPAVTSAPTSFRVVPA